MCYITYYLWMNSGYLILQSKNSDKITWSSIYVVPFPYVFWEMIFLQINQEEVDFLKCLRKQHFENKREWFFLSKSNISVNCSRIFSTISFIFFFWGRVCFQVLQWPWDLFILRPILYLKHALTNLELYIHHQTDQRSIKKI